jgi:hypothetical protein
MIKTLFALVLIVAGVDLAVAQGAIGAERPEYATAAQALEGLRKKPGIKISEQSGWTVIEDRSNFSIQRMVVQDGSEVSLKMHVLCEAPKPDCDAVVAEFGKLNERARDELNSKTR